MPIVDFTDVKSDGPGRVRLPEGDYKARVKGVKQEESKSGNEMLVWEIEITEGKGKGKSLRTYTVLKKENLWSLKRLLEAMGKKVPNSKVNIDLKKYIGLELAITLTDNEYEGKISSQISDYMPVSILDVEDDEDEDEAEEDESEDEEEETPKATKKTKSKNRQVADEDEDIEDIDLDDLD